MQKITWGIIGCGGVTEIKSGPAFNIIEQSSLQMVMRRDAVKAEDYAKRHRVPKWCNDVEMIFNDPDINSIYIATPPSSHADYAIKGLENNFNVYVEKPVALNTIEAVKIANAANLSASKISIAHYRRALPMFQFIGQQLKENIIGEVSIVQINLWQSPKPNLVASSKNNWRVDPSISGGGYFHDLAPHQLDLMLYYFGTPISCNGFSLNQSKQYDADDIVCGNIVFENNVVCNGLWNFSVAEKETKDECTIIGSDGSIRFSFFGKDVMVKDFNGEEKIYHFEHPKHIQQPMIELVVKYFLGEGENPCSIEDAIEVMKMMDAFTQHSR